MATRHQPLSAVEVLPPPAADVDTATETTTQPRTRRQPPYAVVLHNDDINGFDHVIRVLKKVFHYGTPKAFYLTLLVHLRGRGIIWTGSLEVAELKADQVRSCGPDPNMITSGAQALQVSIEPLTD